MKRLFQIFAVIIVLYVIITAIYQLATVLLPGTTNEIVIMVSMAIILGVAWKKWKRDIPRYIKSLEMPGSYLIGQTITVSIYTMILLFAAKHGNHIQIPAYWWIVTWPFLLLMDNTIMERRDRSNLWTRWVFEATTAIFILSMFQNYNSQYIWLISIPYIGMMLVISNDREIFASKNTDWIITLAILLACLTLTVIQFWSPIYSFVTYEILGMEVWMFVSAAITIWIVISVFRWAKDKRLAKKKMIEEQIAREEKRQADELQRAAQRQTKIAHLETLLKEYQEKQDWKVAIEILSLSELMNHGQKKLFEEILIKMDLKGLVTVSEAKKQLVWNDEHLRLILKMIDDLAYRDYNDKILKTIIYQYKEFEKFIVSHTDCIGQEQLLRRLSAYLGNVRSLNALI